MLRSRFFNHSLNISIYTIQKVFLPFSCLYACNTSSKNNKNINKKNNLYFVAFRLNFTYYNIGFNTLIINKLGINYGADSEIKYKFGLGIGYKLGINYRFGLEIGHKLRINNGIITSRLISVFISKLSNRVIDPDYSDQYFYLDPRQEIYERCLHGTKEVNALYVFFSSKLKIRNPEFPKLWVKKSLKSPIDFPQLGDIRECIQQYPTHFIRLTKNLYLCELTVGDFFCQTKYGELRPMTQKDAWLLKQYYDLDQLDFLLQNFDFVEKYYKKQYAEFTVDREYTNYFQHNAQNVFAGTDSYLSKLKEALKIRLKKLKLTSTTLNVEVSVKNKIFYTQHLVYKYSKPLFLTPVINPVKNTEELLKASLFGPIKFFYGDLPFDLFCYLTADKYVCFSYKEDLLDILYQFFFLNKMLNPPFERPIIQLNFFKEFMKNKDIYINEWVQLYGIPREAIIYCFESYLISKNPLLYPPIQQVLEIENKKKTALRPRLTIYNALTLLNLEMCHFIFSFYFRNCEFMYIMNRNNYNFVCEITPFLHDKDKTFVQYGLLDETQLRDAQAILTQILKDTNFLQLFEEGRLELHLDSKEHKLLEKFEEKGFPRIHYQYWWNFINLLFIIEKQIQKAFFDSLVEIFPEIKLTVVTTKEITNFIYDFIFSHRDNKKLFIPKKLFINSKFSIPEILDQLSKKVKSKIGYNLIFEEYNIINIKNDFSKNVFLGNDNFVYCTNLNIDNNLKRKIELFIYEFTQNVSTLTDKNPQLIKKNKFVEFETRKVSNSNLFLRFLEIDILIYQQFPELSATEIRNIRIIIVKIIYKRGFIKSRIYDNFSIKDSVLRMFLEKNNFVTFKFKNSNAVLLRGLLGVKLIKSVF